VHMGEPTALVIRENGSVPYLETVMENLNVP